MSEKRTIGIDRGVAQFLMRLFDRMYKLGVNDAAAADDEGLVYSWTARTQEPGVFGRVGDETSHDPLYWQLTLQKTAFEMGAAGRFTTYARMAGRYGRNYLSVAWVVAQCFYNRGLRDWCDHPEAGGLALFNAKGRVRWDGKCAGWSAPAMVSLAQEFCFERRASDTAKGGKMAIKERHYTAFIKCISLASVVNRQYFS